MIAVDTNILVRLLVADDPEQNALAKRFFDTRLSVKAPGYLTQLVLAETHWTLTRAYGFSADEVRAVLLAVINSAQILVERAELARKALANPSVDFADQLIHLCGQEAGCTTTVTFDRRFAKMAGVELLG